MPTSKWQDHAWISKEDGLTSLNMTLAAAPNHVWSVDFLDDRFEAALDILIELVTKHAKLNLRLAHMKGEYETIPDWFPEKQEDTALSGEASG